MTRDHYNPVALDIDATCKRWLRDPAFANAYIALTDEFETLAELMRARQQQVAG